MEKETTLYDGYDLRRMSPEQQIVLVFEERGWGLFPLNGELKQIKQVYKEQGGNSESVLSAIAAVDKVLAKGREFQQVESGARYLVFPKAYDERPETVKALIFNQFETRRFPFFLDLIQDPNSPFGYSPLGSYLIDSVSYDGKNLDLEIDAELMRYLGMPAVKASIEISKEHIPNLLKTINLACRGKKDNMMIVENFIAKHGKNLETRIAGSENLIH